MSMSTLIGRTAKILELSDIIARQRRLIDAQKAYIDILRSQVSSGRILREVEREREIWREKLPNLLRPQI